MLLLLACASPDPALVPDGDLLSLVDPMIGTGGTGFRVGSVNPAAGLPFGLVKLGPDTADSVTGTFSAYHCAGYHYDDDEIEGFSHLHMHGVGVPDMGTVLVTPVDGWDDAWVDSAEHRFPFSHDNEHAEAGRYTVTLDNGIAADLSATQHAGHHAYTFPDGADPVLIFDLQHNLDGSNSGGELHVDAAAGTVEGWTLNTGSFSGGTSALPVYFSAVVDTGFSDFATWGDDSPQAGRVDAAGIDLGAWLRVTPTTRVRVGISVTSLDGARANLAAELPDQSIDTTAAAAADTWRAMLGRVRIAGGEDKERRIFYTALFHLLQMPTEYADADGQWYGFDHTVHPYAGFTFHSDMSMWDTYRTAHPAFSLLYPEKAADFADSLTAMALTGGAFPRWPVAAGEGGSMLGAPADIVLADTWLRGVRDWDIAAAWPTLMAQAKGMKEFPYNGRPGVQDLDTIGYLPSDEYGSSVAWTQELGWADGSLANLAEALGKTEDAAFFRARAQNYRNQWDPAVGFFHARHRDGSFDAGFDEFAWLDEYTEGNAWQYLFLAPQDAAGLAETLGGEEAARARLDTFFAGAEEQGLTDLPPNYYWHGNEPDLHAAYLYTLWGDPASTAKWTRWIQATWYDDQPIGLAGNDDAGTLSAWYLFASMGFYPLAGSSTWILGIPTFPVVELDLPGGTLRIEREGDGETVAGVELNGAPIDGPTFDQADIADGGLLRFLTE